mmetsp:Transcript_40338/g.72431  ORF Transcript_40338/g.72431 Transcript_40338/m.72431 type:complete len:300 (-) Transcript_40338:117-1016(-)
MRMGAITNASCVITFLRGRLLRVSNNRVSTFLCSLSSSSGIRVGCPAYPHDFSTDFSIRSGYSSSCSRIAAARFSRIPRDPFCSMNCSSRSSSALSACSARSFSSSSFGSGASTTSPPGTTSTSTGVLPRISPSTTTFCGGSAVTLILSERTPITDSRFSSPTADLKRICFTARSKMPAIARSFSFPTNAIISSSPSSGITWPSPCERTEVAGAILATVTAYDLVVSKRESPSSTLSSNMAPSRVIACIPANMYARTPSLFFMSRSAMSTVSASRPMPSSNVSGHLPHSPVAHAASTTR